MTSRRTPSPKSDDRVTLTILPCASLEMCAIAAHRRSLRPHAPDLAADASAMRAFQPTFEQSAAVKRAAVAGIGRAKEKTRRVRPSTLGLNRVIQGFGHASLRDRIENGDASG
jgi:hypothetical protein